tara:strand:+ start:1141 stop:1626 length:486 start_codon:yes stop_codon:yes gene_type:complete
MIKTSPAYLLAASLMLSACASTGLPTTNAPGIESDIKLVNARISHSLEAMLIQECGRGTHVLAAAKEIDPQSVDIEDLHEAISTVDHALECRKERYDEVLAEREALIETVRLTRADIFDAADAEGKADQILSVPNLQEEIREARKTQMKLQDALLRLRTEV